MATRIPSRIKHWSCDHCGRSCEKSRIHKTHVDWRWWTLNGEIRFCRAPKIRVVTYAVIEVRELAST